MSKRAEWLCLGVIVGLLLGALGYVSFRHKLPSPSVFAIDSKVDSSNTPIFATVKTMDCHADFQSARNDRKNAICENAVSLETLESHNGFTKQTENKTTASEKSASSSLRENPQGFSWQSTQAKIQSLESTFDNPTAKSQSKQRAASLENKGYRSPLGDVSLENKRQRCKAKPQQVSLEKVDSSYFAIPNPTPSAHASTIIALDTARVAPHLRDSYGFMALFFAGSREGARDVGIYQSFFVKDSRVSFWAKNGDHCGESALITTQGKSLDSPCKTPFLAPKSCREQLSLENKGYRSPLGDVSLENKRQRCKAGARKQVSLVNRGFQARGEGSCLVGNDRDPSEESTIYRKKPTPKTQKTPKLPHHWSTPREILTPAILSRLSGKFIAKLGNPVSFVDTLGRVHLFVVGVSLGGWATSRVYWLEFDESLEHLHFRQELALSPFANLSFLVRSPALLLEDGGFILPIYHELARKYPLLVRFDSALRLESTFLPLPHIGAKSLSKLQPSFTPLSATKAIGVYRNYTPSAMQVSLCQLQGDLSCQPPKPSNLINYNSSSVLFSVDGLVFLLHNSPPPYALSPKSPSLDSMLQGALPHSREQLHIFVLVPESLDGSQVEFAPVCLLDRVKNAEVSYPSVAHNERLVHIAYTYKRAFIRTALLPRATLVQKARAVLDPSYPASSAGWIRACDD